MSDAAARPSSLTITPHVPLRRVEIVVNPRSGGVGPRAAAECARLMAEFPIEANLVEVDARRPQLALEQAVGSRPDAVIVLAGDGTARTVASLAGAHGPLVAPLPGGTMNMLPNALYGPVDWRTALKLALSEGVARPVSGGTVDGRPFYVAAILGSPALWAPAREAIRSGKVILAWLYARRAAKRLLSGRLRYRLDGGEREKAAALALLCPLISHARPEPEALEAAVLSYANASEVFRLAARTLVNDWRDDPAVAMLETWRVKVWAHGRIPAVLDGEPAVFDHRADIAFTPMAFRALAPAPVAEVG